MKNKKNNQKRMKRVINKLYILIFFIALLLVTTSVHAGTNDSILERNKQNDIFAVAPLSDKTHLYYLEMYTINNIPTYCIELGKKITSTTYNSTSNIEEQKRLTKLTEQQLAYLNMVAYFGYQYKENGIQIHNEREYYMATQEIIWEYLNNINITWTNEEDINGSKINIDKYIDEIKKLINKYNKELNIPNEINLNVGDKKTFEDSSLSIYKLINNKDNLGNIINNKLEINIPNNFIGTSKITLDINNYIDNNPTIYNYEDSQLLLSRGKLLSKPKEITINVNGKTLITNLVDKDTKNNIPQGQATLVGAVYELYDKDNNLVTTFKTDSSLTNVISNLYNEKYYIKQVKASTGYEINKEIIEVDLSKNNNITLEEEVIKCPVTIHKSYEVNKELYRENNIEFSFYYTGPTNNYFNSIITKEGKGTLILPYGKYIITQENTTYGYDKIKPFYFNVKNSQTKPFNYSLINKPITTKLNIITKDKTTNKNIKEENTQYKIKDSNNNYLTYEDKNTFSTNSSGELLLPFNIPYGTYIIEQISPPTNYLINKEALKININENTNYINNEDYLLVNIDYYNIPIKGKITITTNHEEINNKESIISIRPNIEIELYKEDKLINTYTTNEEGIAIINDLELGNYCIVEKETNNKKCISLNNEDNLHEIIEKEVTLTTINEIITKEKNKIIPTKTSSNNIKTIPIPNTLSNKPNLLPIISILLLILGTYIYKKNNKCNHTSPNNN